MTTIAYLNGVNGQAPSHSLTLAGDNSLYGTAPEGGSNSEGTLFRVTTSGTVKLLHSFDGTDGSPNTRLLLANDDNLYGVTNSGTVFRFTPNANDNDTFSVVYSSTGDNSGVALAPGSNGNLYEVTAQGGDNGAGVVYQLTTTGTVTTIHSFNGQEGSNPTGTLIEGSPGVFYGVTTAGGTASLGTFYTSTPSTAPIP